MVYASYGRARRQHNFGQKRAVRRRSTKYKSFDLSKRLIRKFKGSSKNVTAAAIHMRHTAEDQFYHSSHSFRHHATPAHPSEARIAEVTAVPTPIPDAGITTSHEYLSAHSLYLATHTSPHSHVSALSLTPSCTPSPSTFFVFHSFTSTPSPPSSSLSDTSSLLSTSKAASAASHHPISIAIIALLGIGCAFLLLGTFLVYRKCSRPARKPLPIPSKPILDDSYLNDGPVHATDSPIFGGKEHFSAIPGNSGVWTTFPHAVSPTTVSRGSISQLSTTGHGYLVRPMQSPQRFHPNQGEAGQGISQEPWYRNHASGQSLQMPTPTISGQEIGVAIGYTSPRAEEHGDSRPASRLSFNRGIDNAGNPPLKSPSSRRQSSELPYMYSPEPSKQSANIPGRKRVRSSYYTPGSYPRISSVAIPSRVNLRQAPALPKTQTVTTQRRTSTDGSAFRVTSRIQSPGLDIYPDDSLSVAGACVTHKETQKKPAPKLEEPMVSYSAENPSTPTMDTSTALGSLMLTGFGATTKSLATLAACSSSQAASGTTAISEGSLTALSMRRSSSDKPPRVPSPPPLPSLTQMTMQHANPEAYANYKSPTYSICGLYESTSRKSRLGE